MRSDEQVAKGGGTPNGGRDGVPWSGGPKKNILASYHDLASAIFDMDNTKTEAAFLLAARVSTTMHFYSST